MQRGRAMSGYDGIEDKPYYSAEQMSLDFKSAISEIQIVKKKADFDAIINLLVMLACGAFFGTIVVTLGIPLTDVIKILDNLPTVSIIPLGGICASILIIFKTRLLKYRADLTLRYLSDEWSALH